MNDSDPPFRLGHRVPRHVYRGDEPLFTAASEELARELMELLNLGWQAKKEG